MTELYSVFSEDDSTLPVASNLSEDEAYLLNLRISAIDDQSLLSSSMYRSNPADDQTIESIEREICDLLNVSNVPSTLGKAKASLKKLKLNKKEMSIAVNSLVDAYTVLVDLKKARFVEDTVSNLDEEYANRFELLLNDGTVRNTILCRISDFHESIILGTPLSDKDSRYLENLLFMLEAFFNVSESASEQDIDTFGKALALFDKKILVQLVETINYCTVEESELQPREYVDSLGTHYTPPFFYTLYVMQSINRSGFIKWLKSSLFSEVKRSNSVASLFEAALDRLSRSEMNINLGQGSASGSLVFGRISQLFQGVTNSFTVAQLNAAISCFVTGKGTLTKLKDVLDLSKSDHELIYRKALNSADMTPTDSQFTSPVICIFLLTFAMCNISREGKSRRVNIYRTDAEGNFVLDSDGDRILERTVTTEDVSPFGKFSGFLENAKDVKSVLNRLAKANAGRLPLLPSTILNVYYRVDVSSEDLEVILPNDDNPTLKNLTYMRWMSYLYLISNTSKNWGTSTWDEKPSRMLIEDKDFNDEVTAMIFYIRKERTKPNTNYNNKKDNPNPYKGILASEDPMLNPFLNNYELGFNYKGYENDKSTRAFDPKFLEAIGKSEHKATFDALFPTGDWCGPSAIALGFVGAILSPHKNWNDIRNYKCEHLPHGDVEYPNIEVYATAQFNPVTLVTGHKDMTSCCMYPGAYGRSTIIDDFLHPRPSSTLLAFDTFGKNKGNKAYFNNEGDILCLGSIYNARTQPTLKDTSKVSSEYKLSMVEGDTKLFLRYNEPVPYTIGANGVFETPVATLDGFEVCDSGNLVSSSVLGYNPVEVSMRCMAAAINSSPKYNYMISGVLPNYGYDWSAFGIEDSSSAGISFEKVSGTLELVDEMGNEKRINVADNVYTDASQNYSKVRTGFFGSLDVADASSAFGTMVVSFDNEGDNAVVGYLDLDGNEVPQIEVSWDYLRYMFSFPMGNAFVPFEGCVCFDTSAKNKAVCMELLTPAWFASADEKPLVRGENEYNQADLIEMRTPKHGAFLGKTQIL